jgi:hypothetical protein
MEPEGSIPCAQELSTDPYPKPYQSNPHNPSYLSDIHLNIVHPPTYLFSGYVPNLVSHYVTEWKASYLRRMIRFLSDLFDKDGSVMHLSHFDRLFLINCPARNSRDSLRILNYSTMYYDFLFMFIIKIIFFVALPCDVGCFSRLDTSLDEIRNP